MECEAVSMCLISFSFAGSSNLHLLYNYHCGELTLAQLAPDVEGEILGSRPVGCVCNLSIIIYNIRVLLTGALRAFVNVPF